MKRKPRETLTLCAPKPLTLANVISTKTITSHLARLDVTWRLYRVRYEGYGAFGDAVRFVVEGEQLELKKAA